MKKITQKKLNRILANHHKWLDTRTDGEKADLANTDLRGLCLAGADLREIDLRGSDLMQADLRNAKLGNADLSHTNLMQADLRNADLGCANLNFSTLALANADNACFYNALLIHTRLFHASLAHADMENAILAYACLRGANLTDTRMDGADMAYADLNQIDGTPFAAQPEIVPSDGAFVGWKQLADGAIAKLLIPASAKRSSAGGRKCRCSSARVLAIYDAHGKKIEKGFSLGDPNFEYRTGESVHPDAFDENRWNECSHGIHFFITRKEAEDYDSPLTQEEAEDYDDD